MTALLLGSVALMVFGVGMAAVAWEYLRRNPDAGAVFL